MRRVNNYFLYCLCILFAFNAIAAEPTTAPATPLATLDLWPGVAPHEKGDIAAEYNKTAAEGKVRITNVTKPTIAIYKPSPEKDTGTAVMICPGGAYNVLATDIEGDSIRQWLNANGITAILLKYRVPRREGREKHEAPLEDAQRALGLIRAHASDWNIDPHRLGIIGFSAGGHLAAVVSNTFTKRVYDHIDAADDQSCRPDFAMLIYPFYMTPDSDHTKLAPEFHVTSETPPTFIVMTEDDRVWYATTYLLALKDAKVPAEIHIYAKGGHGYGLGKDGGPVATWPRRAEEWLKASGWLKGESQQDVPKKGSP
jgi:acetyl esterase/lipase